jgi:hypothetical protein
LREKELSPIGTLLIQQTNAGLNVTYSITILTILSPDASHPIVLDTRENSNSAEDFFKMVEYWVQAGHLVGGNYLIMDNASIHISDEIHDKLMELLSHSDISIQLLPTYSPELNPCELVCILKNEEFPEILERRQPILA